MTEQAQATTMWSGVVIRMPPSAFDKLSPEEKVKIHAEAIAEVWNNDWKLLLGGIQQSTGLTRQEAVQFYALLLLNSCTKHLALIRDASDFCASQLAQMTTVPPKEPWQEP